MDNQNDGSQLESRPPVLEDLLKLADELNRSGAKYIVIGGMAIIQSGFVRATGDIDLLIDPSPENQQHVRRAMMSLPDQVIQEVAPDDFENYSVIRVADEIVVNLLSEACSINYNEACGSIAVVDIKGVKIPFATPELLWRMKQTVRERDRIDREFLKQLIENRNKD